MYIVLDHDALDPLSGMCVTPRFPSHWFLRNGFQCYLRERVQYSCIHRRKRWALQYIMLVQLAHLCVGDSANGCYYYYYYYCRFTVLIHTVVMIMTDWYSYKIVKHWWSSLNMWDSQRKENKKKKKQSMTYSLIWASIVWVILSLVARWVKERSDRTLIVRERNEYRQEATTKNDITLSFSVSSHIILTQNDKIIRNWHVGIWGEVFYLCWSGAH